MDWRDWLGRACDPCVVRIDDITARTLAFNPADWLAWVQLITSIILITQSSPLA